MDSYTWPRASFASLTVLSLAGLSVLGCRRPAGDSGLTKIVFQADWYPQPEHGGFYTALAKGLLQGRRTGRNDPARRPVHYRGAASGRGGRAVWHGIFGQDSRGGLPAAQPLIAVAATMQRDPQGIMVRKDSPIHSFADLNGHTVAIKVGESTWFEFIVKRFQLNNVHEIPAMMNVANFVADPQYIQQAFATSEPYFAHQAGIETRVLLTSDAGYNPYRVMYHDAATFSSSIPTLSPNLCARPLKGWKDYLNDPGRRARHDRQAQSRAQSGVDAIYLAAIARWPFRRGRRSERRAGRPNGSKTLGDDVRTARRLKSDRQTVRSHDGLHLAISADN